MRKGVVIFLRNIVMFVKRAFSKRTFCKYKWVSVHQTLSKQLKIILYLHLNKITFDICQYNVYLSYLSIHLSYFVLWFRFQIYSEYCTISFEFNNRNFGNEMRLYVTYWHYCRSFVLQYDMSLIMNGGIQFYGAITVKASMKDI